MHKNWSKEQQTRERSECWNVENGCAGDFLWRSIITDAAAFVDLLKAQNSKKFPKMTYK